MGHYDIRIFRGRAILAEESFSSLKLRALADNYELNLGNDWWMKDKLRKGEYTKDYVLKELTEYLSYNFRGPELEEAKLNFRYLQEANTLGIVSKDQFNKVLRKSYRYEALGVSDDITDEGISAVYDMAKVYGSFPFPAEDALGSEDMFIRALTLMRDTDHSLFDRCSSMTSHDGGFGWPEYAGQDSHQFAQRYEGRCVIYRKFDGSDRRRLDFRSLAEPVFGPPTAAESNNSKKSIAYWQSWIPIEGRRGCYQEVNYANDVDEREVDLDDMLAHLHPEWTACCQLNPSLYSHRVVAATLPKQTHHLYQLHIPYSKLQGLVKLLLYIQWMNVTLQTSAGGQEDNAISESLDRGVGHIMNGFGYVGEAIKWETFDKVVAANLESLFAADLLWPFWCKELRQDIPDSPLYTPPSSVDSDDDEGALPSEVPARPIPKLSTGNILSYATLMQINTFYSDPPGRI